MWLMRMSEQIMVGTPDLRLYKREIKTYQNDMILNEKAM